METRRTRRSVARLATVVALGLWAAIVAPLLAALPANAALSDGEIPSYTGWVYVVLVYIAIPVGFFVVCAFLVYLPSIRRKPRYRPSRAWDYDAVWFNGPHDPESALRTVSAIQLKGGGASASW